MIFKKGCCFITAAFFFNQPPFQIADGNMTINGLSSIPDGNFPSVVVFLTLLLSGILF